MKKIKFIAALLILALGIPSCEQRLEEDVYSFLSPSNFYNTYDEGRAGVLSCYADLAELWKGDRGIRDALNYQVDDMNLGGSAANPSRVEVFFYDKLTGSAAHIVHAYTNCYRGIFNVNAAIDALDTKSFARREELIGEAKMYRAYFYFTLIRLYGKVPLITKFEDAAKADQFPRADLTEIYKQIISDLEYAEVNMVLKNETGRPSRLAATTMLADVYLTMAGYPLQDKSKLKLAVEKAKTVVESGKYDLFADFDMATNKSSDNGIEHIFSVQMETDPVGFKSQTGNWYMPLDYFGDANGSGPGRAQGRPTRDLLDAFEIGDQRFDDSFVKWYPNKKDKIITLDPREESESYLFKYKIVDPLTNKQIPGSLDADWHIYRFADALLILAEAENLLNGPTSLAYSAINRIRKRALLPSLSGLSQAEFFTALKRERRVEFFFESKRRFDLIRWGELVSTISSKFPEKNIKAHNVVWPIPTIEIQINSGLKGEQNPGY